MKLETIIEFTNGSKFVRMVDKNGKPMGHQYIPVIKGNFTINASVIKLLGYK